MILHFQYFKPELLRENVFEVIRFSSNLTFHYGPFRPLIVQMPPRTICIRPLSCHRAAAALLQCFVGYKRLTTNIRISHHNSKDRFIVKKFLPRTSFPIVVVSVALPPNDVSRIIN